MCGDASKNHLSTESDAARHRCAPLASRAYAIMTNESSFVLVVLKTAPRSSLARGDMVAEHWD